MAQNRKSFHFEVTDADSRNDSLGMVNSYINRQGIEPVPVFASGAQVVRALSELRREGYSQSDVASEMGIGPAALSRIESEVAESNPREPNLATIKSYAHALGFDVLLVCVPLE